MKNGRGEPYIQYFSPKSMENLFGIMVPYTESLWDSSQETNWVTPKR